jgi:2-polyprenyl-3-methyl-5-hydroxy-6-metoxy-1,4-benzoquinol methylase
MSPHEVHSAGFHPQCDIASSSDDYARRFAGGVGEQLLSVQTRGVMKVLSPWAGKRVRVLDVGGGHGQLVGPLVEAGFDVTVLGSDESCRRRCDRAVRRERYTFVVGDISAPPFGNSSFDVVVSVRIMAHIPDWQRFVGGLCRVAKEAVVIDYPTIQSVNALTPMLYKLKKRSEGNTRPYRLLRHREVYDCFREHGCNRFSRIGQFVFPMALHRISASKTASSVLTELPRVLGMNRMLGSPCLLRAMR